MKSGVQFPNTIKTQWIHTQTNKTKSFKEPTQLNPRTFKVKFRFWDSLHHQRQLNRECSSVPRVVGQDSPERGHKKLDKQSLPLSYCLCLNSVISIEKTKDKSHREAQHCPPPSLWLNPWIVGLYAHSNSQSFTWKSCYAHATSFITDEPKTAPGRSNKSPDSPQFRWEKPPGWHSTNFSMCFQSDFQNETQSPHFCLALKIRKLSSLTGLYKCSSLFFLFLSVFRNRFRTWVYAR